MRERERKRKGREGKRGRGTEITEKGREGGWEEEWMEGFLPLSLGSITKISRAGRNKSEVPTWATLKSYEVSFLSWKVIKPRE